MCRAADEYSVPPTVSKKVSAAVEQNRNCPRFERVDNSLYIPGYLIRTTCYLVLSC